MSEPPILPSNPSQDRGPTIVGFLAGFTTAAGLAVAVRLTIRYQKRVLGWDDLAICFASIAFALMTVFGSLSVHQGYGKHLGDIPRQDAVSAFFWFYIAQICYKCVTWPTKLSILLMYRRIFGETPDIRAYGIRFRHLLTSMLTLVVGAFVATSVVGIFSCRPIAYAWNKSLDGSCVHMVPWWFSYSALNITSDIVILAMPVPLINGLLHVTKRQKLVLIGVFMLGAFVCIVTIVRMTTLKTGAQSNDSTYTGAVTLKWTAVEAGVGIICACLPVLRPLLTGLIPWFANRARTLRTKETHNAQTHTANSLSARRQSWSKLQAGRSVYMSDIAARPTKSCNSSEVGIADGIVCKVEYGTLIENADEFDGDAERHTKPTVSSNSVV